MTTPADLRAAAFLKVVTWARVALVPVILALIAVVLGSLLLGEPFSPRILVAGALVLTGTAVVRGVQSTSAPAATARRADA